MAKRKSNKGDCTWLPIGVTLGCVLGLIFYIEFNDIVYSGICIACGLLIGTIMDSSSKATTKPASRPAPKKTTTTKKAKKRK